MMKRNLVYIFLIGFSVITLNCKQSFRLSKSKLVDNIWTSDIVHNYCTDSLQFQIDNQVTYYSCEIGWHYDGFYKIYGDTIEIGINLSQQEIDKYDKNNYNSRYLLIYQNNALEWLKIEHKGQNGFEEVESEVYEQIRKWTK